MKLQCEQCSTNYTIADGKIQGQDRVFKIRCKTCGAIITFNGVSDGSQAAADDEPPSWYYVKDGDRVGPLTSTGMRAAYTAGEFEDASYVWQAGMADWAPMADVPALAGLVQPQAAAELPTEALDAVASEPDDGAPTEADQPEPASEVAVANPDTSTEEAAAEAPAQASPADEPAESASEPESAPEPQAEPDDPGGQTLDNLFVGGAAAAAGPSDDDLFGGASDGDLFGDAGGGDDMFGGGAEQDPELVYQRHDNSVLFSLNDLDDKAGAKPASAAAAAAAIPAAGTPDSGLVDIRQFSKRKREQSASGDLFGDLVGEEAATEAPLGVASAPVAPIIARRKKASGGMMFAVVFAVLIGLGGIAFGVVQMMKKDEGSGTQPQVAQAPTPPPAEVEKPAAPAAEKTGAGVGSAEAAKAAEAKPTEAEAAPVEAKPVEVKPAEAAAPAEAKPEAAGDPADGTDAAAKPEEGADAAPTEGAPGAKPGEVAKADGADAEPAKKEVEKPKEPPKPLTAEERKKLRERREKLKIAREERKAKEAAAKAAKEKEAAAKAAKEKAASKPKVDPNNLLNQVAAAKPKEKPKEAAPSANEDLPNQPSNTQVKKVMRGASSKIRNCVNSAGESNVQVMVAFKIAPSGSVSGASASGTAAAGCVKGAVSGLRFPKSRQGRSVRYPVRVK